MQKLYPSLQYIFYLEDLKSFAISIPYVSEYFYKLPAKENKPFRKLNYRFEQWSEYVRPNTPESWKWQDPKSLNWFVDYLYLSSNTMFKYIFFDIF